VGSLIAEYFERRDWEPHQYLVVSKRAGLARQWVERTINSRGEKRKVSRGTLLKVAAAMDLNTSERTALENAIGKPGSLRKTEAELLEEDELSMRRAVMLLTAPTDPHLLPFRARRGEVAIRSGVVFGWHDVVVRITTPEGVSVLDYSDRLFKSKSLRSTALRTTETILLRDDLPVFVDRSFTEEGLHADDYHWAVIFVQALGTPEDPEFRDIFHEVASRIDFQGGIHLLTAAIAVGQFDTVVEVLAANLSCLQRYVRAAQERSNELGREVHTVTYFAENWQQRPKDGSF
jgi:hypothetical protein